MIPTAKFAELAALADQRSWRVVLVGDPLQFSAVGRGGMFGLAVDTFGAVELDSVHRFTHAWERDASLRLRRGDVDVLDLYGSHERLRGGPSPWSATGRRGPSIESAATARSSPPAATAASAFRPAM